MWQLLLLIHVLICIALVALILLQHGKGADIGAAFGSGASQTVFGSAGSTSFLTKITMALVALFFISSITLGYIASKQVKQSSAALLPPTTVTVPAQPTKTTNINVVPAQKNMGQLPATQGNTSNH